MAKKRRKKSRKKRVKRLKRKKRTKKQKRKIKEFKKKVKKIKKTKNSKSAELIFKIPIPHMLTKASTRKNINYQLKIMKVFGEKKVNELIGLNLIKK